MTTRKKTPRAAHQALLNDAAVLLECVREHLEKERSRKGEIQWGDVGDAQELVRILLDVVANPHLSDMNDPNGVDDEIVKRRVLADARRRMRSIVWTIEPARAARRGVRK